MNWFHNDWNEILNEEIQQPYFQKLIDWLDQEYNNYMIYPPKQMLFEALKLTSFVDTKVVILGQDPYHGARQAHGLSFSVQPGVPVPPSLRNIYKEMSNDLGVVIPQGGTLTPWAEQGVLLLNNVLTVREGEAGSHQRKGWEAFTDAIVAKLNERERPVVFVLWGNHAQKKGAMIDQSRHKVIASAHPSPLAASRGFFGSKPFSKINHHLQSFGDQPIEWTRDMN